MTGAAEQPCGDRPSQLVLELPHATGTALSDYMEAPCNAAALAAIRRWPDWPAPVLVLSGPPASGKTHLARIWAERSGAAFLAGEARSSLPTLLGTLVDAGHWIADDADRIMDEALLFHLHNAVLAAGGCLLLTTSRPLADWPLRLPDLRSRLLAAGEVRIDAPSDALLTGLLVKQLADRQLRVEPPVIDYLVARMERSFAAARRVVAALDRAGLREQRPITLALARQVLAGEGVEAEG